MAIGLLGGDTTSVPRLVEEVRNTDEGPVMTQHLLVVETNVQDHLNKRTTATHMFALVKDNFLHKLGCLFASKLFLSSEIRPLQGRRRSRSIFYLHLF